MPRKSPEHNEPIMPDEERHQAALEWQRQAEEYEGSASKYGMFRTDGESNWPFETDKTINELHGMSFLEYIERRLGERSNSGKFKVLDVGGGAGLFADQLKEKFGDDISVFTTGLKKSVAQEQREQSGKSSLPKEYLKWRSIRELQNFPEFDLITDTFGEFYYEAGGTPDPRKSEKPKNAEERLRKYLYAIVAKLDDEGMASCSPLPPWLKAEPELAENILEELKSEFPEWNIHTDVFVNEGFSALRILKERKAA